VHDWRFWIFNAAGAAIFNNQNINDMLQVKLKETLASAQALLDKVDSTGGVMTAEQQAEFDGYSASIKSYKEQIAAREQFTESSAFLKAGVRSIDPQNIIVGKTRIEDDPKGGFDRYTDFALAVRSACANGGTYDARLNFLAAPSGAMIGRGSDEGFMMPVEFREQVWKSVEGNESEYDLFNLMPPEPTSKNSIEQPTDETTPWGTSGVQAYYGAEADQMTKSSLVTDGIQMALKHCYAYVVAGEDLLDDAPRLNQRLTVDAGKALTWKMSDALMNGDGVGKPKGIANAGCLVVQAKETNQTAATVVAANIAKMYSRLVNPKGGVWFINPDVFPQIMLLSANNNPLWVPMDRGFTYAPSGMLLGRPVYPLEHCQTLGTQGDIYFVNPKGYLHVMKTGGVKYAESIHLYFDYNVKAFRYTVRHAGMPYAKSAISPKNGSNTRSPLAVTLAVRS